MDGVTEKKQRVRTLTKKDIEIKLSKKFEGKKISEKTAVDALFDSIRELLMTANPDLRIESRFDLAYNAAHALCLAALRKAGYRSSKRYTVFQTLPHTLGLGAGVWRMLNRAHQLRNDAEYEGYMEVEESFVKDLIVAAEAVKAALAAPRKS